MGKGGGRYVPLWGNRPVKSPDFYSGTSSRYIGKTYPCTLVPMYLSQYVPWDWREYLTLDRAFLSPLTKGLDIPRYHFFGLSVKPSINTLICTTTHITFPSSFQNRTLSTYHTDHKPFMGSIIQVWSCNNAHCCSIGLCQLYSPTKSPSTHCLDVIADRPRAARLWRKHLTIYDTKGASVRKAI